MTDKCPASRRFDPRGRDLARFAQPAESFRPPRGFRERLKRALRVTNRG